MGAERIPPGSVVSLSGKGHEARVVSEGGPGLSASGVLCESMPFRDVEQRDLVAFLADHPRCWCGRSSSRRVDLDDGPMACCSSHAADLEDEMGA